MQTLSLEQKCRKRAWLFLSPGVAACAGMTLPDLQQFIAGKFFPNPEQLRALAKRMSIPV
jgi:hypothetical protein